MSHSIFRGLSFIRATLSYGKLTVKLTGSRTNTRLYNVLRFFNVFFPQAISLCASAIRDQRRSSQASLSIKSRPRSTALTSRTIAGARRSLLNDILASAELTSLSDVTWFHARNERPRSLVGARTRHVGKRSSRRLSVEPISGSG